MLMFSHVCSQCLKFAGKMRLLALLLCIGASLAAKQYNGYKILRFVPYDEMDLITLEMFKTQFEDKIDIFQESVDFGMPTDIMVTPDLFQYLEINANDLDIAMEIISDDVQSLIDNERDMAGSERADVLETYLTVDQIYDYLDAREAECGAMSCNVNEYGTSYEGRSLRSFEISTGPGKPAIFLECGIHAREWVSPAVCLNIINKMVNDYETDADTRRMLDNFDWNIMPSANPDGYSYCFTNDRMWRKTRQPYGGCVGADPNRNFAYQFGGPGSSNQPCTQTYRGPNAFSEPETAAIEEYVIGKGGAANTRAYFSIHSYGQYFLVPWAYDRGQYPDDFDDLMYVYQQGANALNAETGLVYRVDQSADLLGPAAGGSDDWAKGTLGIKFTQTMELRDTGRYAFILPESEIEGNFREIYASLVRMTEIFENEFPGPFA